MTGGPQDNLAARMTELEMLLMHLQQTVQQLDEVVQEQGARIALLERLTARLRDELRDELRDMGPTMIEPRRLEDDKPPHY